MGHLQPLQLPQLHQMTQLQPPQLLQMTQPQPPLLIQMLQPQPPQLAQMIQPQPPQLNQLQPLTSALYAPATKEEMIAELALHPCPFLPSCYPQSLPAFCSLYDLIVLSFIGMKNIMFCLFLFSSGKVSFSLPET